MKKWIRYLLPVILLLLSFSGCGGAEEGRKIMLYEDQHSVFYAPLYVAMEKGFFEEEGIEISMTDSVTAEKITEKLLAGGCDVGLFEPENSIYVYNSGEDDYLIGFAQLTQRSGDFLVSRSKEEEFSWDKLKGKTVITGSSNSLSGMVFGYILGKHGIETGSDLTLYSETASPLTYQTFINGTGDYTLESEPTATKMELKEEGKIAIALASESGKVPTAAFFVRKSFLEKNREYLQRFTNSIQKGLDYITAHSPKEIAKVIQPQFSEIDPDALTLMVTNYYRLDVWKANLIFEEGSFTFLQDILEEAGMLAKQVPYQDIINTELAKKAVE